MSKLIGFGVVAAAAFATFVAPDARAATAFLDSNTTGGDNDVYWEGGDFTPSGPVYVELDNTSYINVCSWNATANWLGLLGVTEGSASACPCGYTYYAFAYDEDSDERTNYVTVTPSCGG